MAYIAGLGVCRFNTLESDILGIAAMEYRRLGRLSFQHTAA